MSYYGTLENIEQYIDMSKEYDGQELIGELKKYLSEGSTVLELGMGEGKDQQFLKDAGFIPTGSDSSQPFLDRYNNSNPKTPAIYVDAISMDTELTFDAIYANKVLQHLTADELKESLKNQVNNLNENGILFFSLWYGDDSGDMGGSFYMSHTEKTVEEAILDTLEVLAFNSYTEMEENDSFWAVLKKRK